jgi:hypothetical protein
MALQVPAAGAKRQEYHSKSVQFPREEFLAMTMAFYFGINPSRIANRLASDAPDFNAPSM